MKLINGLLKYPAHIEKGNMYLFTANSIVKNNGELVMGGGNALAFAQTYPESPKVFGASIKATLVNGTPIKLVHYARRDEGLYAAFIVKKHFKDKSPIEMVENAVWELQMIAEVNMDLTIHLPYPAIGLGGLTVKQVQPLLDTLPDNVLVYKA